MTSYIALRDRRLRGGVPKRAGLHIVNTDATRPLASAFHEIRSIGRSGRVHTMFVLCHGFAGVNNAAQVSMDAGGMGLQLGRENVVHANADRWVAIQGQVTNIVIYSCAAANTEQGNAGTTADGRYLMGALALYTQANVYAADRIQWYTTLNNLSSGRFEFGAWEGTLYHFPVDGTPPRVVKKAPVELADVMGGTAP